MSAAHYARKAEAALDGVHDWQAEVGITDETMLTLAIEANVQATLALAEQQRIANLIAWTRSAGYDPTPSVQEQIEKGLGL